MEFKIATVTKATAGAGNSFTPCTPLIHEECTDPWEDRFVAYDLPRCDLRVGEPCVGIFTSHRHDSTLLFTYAAITAITEQAKEWIADHPSYRLAFIGFHQSDERDSRLFVTEVVMAILQEKD